jgi:hypothetical protein
VKKLVLTVVIVVGVIDAGWHGVSAFLEAIDRGKYKRVLADARSVATALEEYRRTNGSYPATMSTERLATMVTPTHIRKLPGELRYFSDGEQYTLLLGWPLGAYTPGASRGNPIEVRDGIVVSAPEWLKIAPSGRLLGKGRGVQPDFGLNGP